MSYPIFHPDEEARIGQYALDERHRGKCCTILRILPPLAGEHRYKVRTDEGQITFLLECSLQKRFERSDWGMLRGIWQPKREAR